MEISGVWTLYVMTRDINVLMCSLEVHQCNFQSKNPEPTSLFVEVGRNNTPSNTVTSEHSLGGKFRRGKEVDKLRVKNQRKSLPRTVFENFEFTTRLLSKTLHNTME